MGGVYGQAVTVEWVRLAIKLSSRQSRAGKLGLAGNDNDNDNDSDNVDDNDHGTAGCGKSLFFVICRCAQCKRAICNC